MIWRKFKYLLFSLLFLSSAHGEDTELSIAYGLENYNFETILAKFSQETGIKIAIYAFKNNDLKAELLQRKATEQLPDAVIVPSDFVGLTEINFSAIPPAILSPELTPQSIATTQINKQSFGVPIIAGNHLLFMYNKKLVSSPASTWEELLNQTALLPKDVELITWSYHEMYWFVPFLGVFGDFPLINGQLNLDTAGMRKALVWYHELAEKKVVEASCDYSCSVEKFKSGKAAYIINGTWAYDILSDTLGENLGIALLPSYHNKPMKPYFSSHMIAFPGDGLSGEKANALKQLAQFFQRKDIQQYVWDEMRSLPTNQLVMQKIRQLDDANINVILTQLSYAEPLPNDKAMAIVWEAMLKGVNRYHAGVFDLDKATKYMHYIAEKSINNDP